MRMPRARFVLACLVIPAASSFVACAEAPPPVSQTGAKESVGYQQKAGYAQAPQQPYPPGMTPSATAAGRFDLPGLVEVAPRSVPDAVAQLDRAEQLLGFMLTPAAPGDVVKSPPPQGTSIAAGTPVPLGDPCLIACAALASMKRSAEHVCTMAGDKDAACDSARARVQRAEQRVTASCPACAASVNQKRE